MPSTFLARRARLLACGAALALGACGESADTILSVQDPDIINPADVQSPAGANAVRIGALGRLNGATSGAPDGQEAVFMLGGLLADEWRSGDTFIARDEIDARIITRENTFLTTANRRLHRARLSAQQAVGLLEEYSAPAWQVAEMYFVQSYVENILAEHWCSGIIFSTVSGGAEQFGSPVTTAAAYEMALAHVDSGLALVPTGAGDTLRVRNALAVTKGRILMNMERYAEAATAVAAVPTAFRYNMAHSQTTNDNSIWALNNSARRYTVSSGEGTVGLVYATANDPRVPTCVGNDAVCRVAPISVTQPRTFDNATTPLFHVQRIWPARDASVDIVSGVAARLIEAEAQLAAANPGGALATLNTLRAAGAGNGGVTGLAPLADAGTPAARLDQVFRERAFWLFGRGYRLGDMRRLVRQYDRDVNAVFPNGAFHKAGSYGPDVNFPIPQSEENNPNANGAVCLDRNA